MFTLEPLVDYPLATVLQHTPFFFWHLDKKYKGASNINAYKNVMLALSLSSLIFLLPECSYKLFN
jgi:hypothetical protein